MKQGFYSQHANANWRICHAGLVPLLTAVLCGGLLATGHAQTNYQRLRSFGFPELSGALPRSPLIEGSDGKVYGTSPWGGANRAGTVFRMNKDGSGCTALHYFTSNAQDGAFPVGNLVEGSDGVFYGTTLGGGSIGWGTVFKLSQDGGNYQVLHSFGGQDGGQPQGGLLQGSDGALYGTTLRGGMNDVGTVFKLNKDGSGFAILRNFIQNNTEGAYPEQVLKEGQDGTLYGTAGADASVSGTVFSLSKDGSNYTVLHRFAPSVFSSARLVFISDTAVYGTVFHGSGVRMLLKINTDGSGYSVLRSDLTGDLVAGSDGALYGMLREMNNNTQSIFKLNKEGDGYAMLCSFILSEDVHYSEILLQGTDGAFYGRTLYSEYEEAGEVFRLDPKGCGYTVLRQFSGSGGDGTRPDAPVIEGSGGVLYGTTPFGGRNGLGTIFSLNKDGTGYKVLRSISTESSTSTRLLAGTDGALYGATRYGGANRQGTVFKVNTDGTDDAVLHQFTGGDGGRGVATLAAGRNGVLYGITLAGGTNECVGFGCTGGTVFKLDRDGNNFAVLHHFQEGLGIFGSAGLVQGSDGALYGTTHDGGASGYGLVFKLNPDGSGYTILHDFVREEGNPISNIIEGNDGALYGITGESPLPFTTVFKLSTDGSRFTVLYQFIGALQHARLVQARDGTFYGTAGTVFKLYPDGSGYKVLRSFTGNDGFGAVELIQASDGALYGTTSRGGDMDFGTVFKLFASTPVVSIDRIESDGAGARLNLSGGAADQTFQIHATPNLTTPSWQAIGTNQFGIDGKFQFLDTSASNYPTRFYRSATP